LFSLSGNNSVQIALVIVLFSFIIFVGFRNVINQSMLAYSDMSPFPVSVQQGLEVIQSSWQPPSGAFWYSSIDLAMVVRILFIQLTLGNAGLAQKLFIVVPYILSFTGLYLVLQKYIKSKFASFLGAFLYAVNPLTITVFLGGAMGWMYVHGILPFLFLLMLKISEEKSIRCAARDVCLFGILFAVAFSMGAQIVLFMLPFLLFVLLNGLRKRKLLHFARVFSLISIAFLIGIILCLPVFLPMSKELVSYTAPGQVSARDVEMNYKYENSVDPILSILSLQPTELDVFGWDINPSMVILSMAIPLLAFSAVLIRRKWPDFVVFSLFFAACTIAFIYLGYLGVTIPLFRYFRFLEVLPVSNAPAMLLVFFYALLIGYALDVALSVGGGKLKNSLWLNNKYLQKACCVFIFIVFSAISWPLLTGSMGLFAVRSQTVAGIPSEFYTISNWLSEKRATDPYARSLWLPYSYNDIEIRIRYLDRQSVIASRSLNRYVTTDFTAYTVDALQKVFIDKTSVSAGELVGPLSVKYIIVWLGSEQTGLPRFEYERGGVVGLVGSPDEFKKILSSQKDLEMVFSTEKFVIYENLRCVPYLSLIKNGAKLVSNSGTSVDDVADVMALSGSLPLSVGFNLPMLLNNSTSNVFSSEVQLLKNETLRIDTAGNYTIFFTSVATPLIYVDGVLQSPTEYNNTYVSKMFLSAGTHNLTTIEKPRSMSQPVLSWKLDEGSGRLAKDYSPNSLDGTFTGNFTWVNEQNRAVPLFEGSGVISLDKMSGIMNQSYTVVMVAEFEQVGDNPAFRAMATDPSKYVGIVAFGSKVLLLVGNGDQDLQLKSDTVLESNNLYQIAFGRDTQNRIFLAINGRVEKTIVDASSVADYGSIHLAPGMVGKVYDFKVFNASLSEDDLAYLNRRTDVLKLKPTAVVLKLPDIGLDISVNSPLDLRPKTNSNTLYRHELVLNPQGNALIYLAEPFDSRWIAYDSNGTKLDHFIAYGGMNAFLIQGYHDEKIVVFFEEQTNRDSLISLWIVSWGLTLGLLVLATNPISRIAKKTITKIRNKKEGVASGFELL